MILLGAIALLVALILLERRRQMKRYGPGSGRGASLARTGMVDLQRHLQPDRKVEIFLKDEARTDHETSGDPPRPKAR